MRTKVETNEVQSVYSGRDGECCCGCSGTHYEMRDLPQGGTTLKTVKMVNKVVKIVNEALDNETADRGPNYVAATIGTRVYIAYFD